MKQLTVRGLDEELSERVRRLAEHEHISLNQAALRLLRKGAGLPASSPSNGKDLTRSESGLAAGTYTLRELARMPLEERHKILVNATFHVDAQETAAWDSLPDELPD